MESIKYTPECVQKSEEDDHSALGHRDRVLEHFSTAPGLGPIDLVVCRKAGKGPFGEQHCSFFHQVLGHDLTSTASAAAYFAELCSSTEEVGFIPGLFTAQQWKVTQCVYCCFDAFSRLDVRCHMSVPGGVTAYAIDMKGKRYEMTAAHWKRVSVSAFLRYEYYHPSIFRGIPGVVHRHGVRTPDAEEAILDSIVDLYHDRVPAEVLNMLRPGGQRGGALPEDNDPMLAAVLQHFKRRRVLEGAVEFFTQVASLYAPAVVHLCCALEALGRSEDALQVLRSNAVRMPHDINVICALAAAEAAIGSQKDALQLARHALLLAPKSTTTLLCMARMQAMCGAPALAVLAMHLIVPPSDPSVLIRRVFPCGLPPHDRVTTPVCKAWPLEEHEATILEEEMNVPKRFDQATNWLRVVKQLCGISDDGTHDELPYIPADVHSDTATLRTSIVRLLPFIQGQQYLVITMCMKEVGMHNFMRILQALSRSASEKAAREAAPQEPSKPAAPPPASDKPSQKRRSKRSTAAFKPLSARQRSGADVTREASWAASHATSADGSSADKVPQAVLADPAEAAGGHSTSSLPAGSGATSTVETDAEVSAAVDAVEPVEAVESLPTERSEAAEAPVDTSGSVAAGSASDAVDVQSEPHLADPGSAPSEQSVQPQSPAPPPPPVVVADLSRVPVDLVPGDSRVRQVADPEGHPVAEAVRAPHSTSSGSGPLPRRSSEWVCLPPALAAPDALLAGPFVQGCGALGGGGLLSKGDGARRALCWAKRSRPVAEARRSLSQESLLHAAGEPDSAPQPEDHAGGGPVGESPEAARADSGPAPHSWGYVNSGRSAEGMPLEALQDALHGMEYGSPGLTAERLGRLQLRAQEYAARVVPGNALRARHYKKLQLGAGRQRRDGPVATSEAQNNAATLVEGVGPMAFKIVDHGKLQSAAEQLMEESKQRKSTRHAECLQVLAALLVATTAPPGAIQEVAMNVAHLVTLVLQDLDDASHVHSAAVHETTDVNAKGLLASAELVQHNCNQFLQFQHHPLGGAALPDASVTEAATVGDWLTWAGACERLGCQLHARYAYTKSLVKAQPRRSLTAHLAVARLIAAEADIHTVFDHLTEVLLMMDHRRDQVLGTSEAAHGVIKEGQVASSIIAVVAAVIDAWGMSAIQARLEKGSGQYHPSIEPTVEQAFGWGTDGCDA